VQRQTEARQYVMAHITLQIRTKTLVVLVLFFLIYITKYMRFIEFFAGKQALTTIFESNGYECFSLDNNQVSGARKIDFLVNFMNWDYKSYDKNYFNIIWFGFPCTTFSKASGGKHFLRHAYPLTDEAKNSIIMLKRMFEIINWFDTAIFYIENPAGGMINNIHFLQYFDKNQAFIFRLDQSTFGYYTQKPTDIFTNSKIPFLSCPHYRVKGKRQKIKFDNLSLVNRQAYTVEFARFIFENAIKNL
jgi:hypothetical protein